MKLDRVIVRTILNTLCAILVLCSILFLSASFVFPSAMMKVAYKLGDDDSAMKYAYTAYSRTNFVDYIAFATDVALGVDSDEEVAKYGELFISDEKFLECCSETDTLYNMPAGSYYKYIYGKVVVALYNLNEKQKAFDYAMQSVSGGFEENNALVALFIQALVGGDAQTVAKVETEFLKLSPTLSTEMQGYLNELLALTKGEEVNA